MPSKHALRCVADAWKGKLAAVKTGGREKNLRKTNIMATESTGVETRRAQTICLSQRSCKGGVARAGGRGGVSRVERCIYGVA